MHGIVFTSFRQFVLGRFGGEIAATAWTGRPAHVITDAYPDDDFQQLFDGVCDATGSDPDDLLREFGVFTGERTFVLLYPSAYEEAGGARTFLLRVEERIHELVRATVPGARPPRLRVAAAGDDGVCITYASPRRLCVLLEGLLLGTARHYGEEASYEEVRCMRRGDDACVFEVRLRAPAASPG